MTAVDLEQLVARESEQIEWKENVADVEDVVATLSAFANDLANLGGGYVVCGAAERPDEHGFPSIHQVGLTAQRLKEIEGKVLQLCRDRVSPAITPLVEEIPLDEAQRRILVFIQPATPFAHSFRNRQDGTKHFVRVGRMTSEARNGVLRNLLIRKGDMEPWDRRPCATATINDLDLLALRDSLQRMRVFSSDIGVEPYLSQNTQISAFVPPLCAKEALTGILRPRNFAVLLFGRDVQRFIPGAVSMFSIYPSVDRSDVHAERHEIAGTLVEQSRRLAQLLDVQSYSAFDKADTRVPNALKYPKRALYEAMGNALAHRDYELPDPTRITVFDDRIEMSSPGSLPFGVDPAAFREGRSGPRWRNQALAWFFNRLQMAQAEGQGIPTILRTMREEGCPPPLLEADEIRVVCVLPAHPRHALLRRLREVEQMIALGRLPAANESLRAILSDDPSNFRALQLFAEVQIALRDPQAIADVLTRLGPEVYSLPSSVLVLMSEGLSAGDHRPDRYRDLSSRLLKAASRGRLEEKELRRIGVALLRNREEDAVLALIDRHLGDRPELRDTASILQLRGDAFLGLAKKCKAMATKDKIAGATRDRSWRSFDDYLAQAEAELRRAERLSADDSLTRIIGRNLSYLDRLREEQTKRRRPR